MKAIVTGGSGFIGSNLALTLEQKGAQVIVIDDFRVGDFRNLDGFRGDVIAQDVNQVNWNALGTVDVIFHEAAITDTTLEDQQKMIYDNVEGMRKALQFAIQSGARFVYASSAAQYGNLSAPQKDDGKVDPLNVYAFSKMLCDRLATECAQETKLPIVGLRYFNVFGPREKYKGKASSMIYQLAEQMRAGKRPRIFSDGEQSRDHIYVKDIVSANLKAFEAPKSCIVNAGTGKPTSFNRLVEILNQVLGTDFEPDYFENPYGFYQNKTQASTARAKKLIGFEAKYSIEAGIRDYLTEIYQLKPAAKKNASKREKVRV